MFCEWEFLLQIGYESLHLAFGLVAGFGALTQKTPSKTRDPTSDFDVPGHGRACTHFALRN